VVEIIIINGRLSTVHELGEGERRLCSRQQHFPNSPRLRQKMMRNWFGLVPLRSGEQGLANAVLVFLVRKEGVVYRRRCKSCIVVVKYHAAMERRSPSLVPQGHT
jgi:hypothetical protein